MLVHERFGASVSTWHAEEQQQRTPSPYHMWLRLEGGPCLARPLFLAAVYLPPYRSKYGLQSPSELDEYFALLGDEVAAALGSVAGGADVALAGDVNAHMGVQQDFADHSDLLEAALHDAAEDVLLPCASHDTAYVPIPRASSCRAPVCKQGSALLQFCCATGLLLFNGRVKGDLHGASTCFTGSDGSLIDIIAGSPSLLLQAAELLVLPPVPEYRGHRPLALTLGMPSSTSQHSAATTSSTPTTSATSLGSDSYGPPPSFAPALRIIPDSLKQFASELQEPAIAAQLQHLADSASSDPLQAATQLHSLLYSTAAAVFPTASTASRQQSGTASSTSRQLRRRYQPWFDGECAAVREQLRQQTLDSLNSRQHSHLAKEALRVLGSKNTPDYGRINRQRGSDGRAQLCCTCSAHSQPNSSNAGNGSSQPTPSPPPHPAQALHGSPAEARLQTHQAQHNLPLHHGAAGCSHQQPTTADGTTTSRPGAGCRHLRG